MLTLHLIDHALDNRGPVDPVLSIGILDPHPPDDKVWVYDFGTATMRSLLPGQLLSVGEGHPARTSFVPRLRSERYTSALAANRAKVIRLPVRRKRPAVPTHFVTGYDEYAAGAARYWRQEGVGTQPLLAAGVFSLSTIQTPIVTALKLFSLLTPHVIADKLPSAKRMSILVKRAGAGLDSPRTGRPRWYVEYAAYRKAIVAAMDMGLRDDPLRRAMSIMTPLPRGLGLAKLSFTLALVGNNLGCLDARIVRWAYTPKTAERFLNRVGQKRDDGTVTEGTYETYRRAELRILEKDSPFYDARDPVALARSQWMLWESLGAERERTHTHAELFEAVLEDRLDSLS